MAIHVTVVRPYAPRIRKKMFGHIEKAGLVIDPANIIAGSTPDDEALEILSGRRDHVFLIPFHAHLDADGKEVNGLDFANRLHADYPSLRHCKILMPASTFAAASAELRFANLARFGLQEELGNRILLITEDELDEPDLADKIRRHVVG